MKVVVFAGGVGTRLWPLSRKKSPKQFERIIGNKSTLQLAVERVVPDVPYKDIYVSTGNAYTHLVAEQLKEIPPENIIAEPVKRDVGPAVAMVMGKLARDFPHEPTLIMWSDHLVKKTNLFKHIVKEAAEMIYKNNERIVFIGQRPRFPSEDLGWIKTDGISEEHNGILFRTFEGFKYRPDRDLAQKYFADPAYCWNLAYFVSTPTFIYSQFKRFSPNIYRITEKILNHPKGFVAGAKEYYHEMPEINFDHAVLEQLEYNYARVIVEDVGWSDVGAWEALKESLQEARTDNITKGEVLLEDCADNLVYNYDNGKLVVGIDLHDALIVNTNDVLLVANKSSVSKVKKLVERFQGTVHEELA